MKKTLEKCYYIGDPASPTKRGQDKHGMVHSLLWLMIYPKGDFFAKRNEYSLAKSGGGIGKVKSITEGRKKLHTYAVQELTEQKNACLDELRRINEALETLGDNPANLECFAGEYK